MRRIAIGLVLGFGLGLLAACGGHDETQDAARKAKEATQVTVESAQPAGAAAGEDTQVTVESAETGQKPAQD